MKKTLIAMFALAGLAMAADTKTNTVNLSDLMSTSDGIILNGSAKTDGAAIGNNVEFSTSFDTMSGAVSQLQKWYVNRTDANVGENPTPVSKGVSFVTDGPSGDTAGRWAAFAYELDAATLADMAAADSALTLTFNASVTAGNNKKSQTIDFYLMSSASIFHPTDSYGNKINGEGGALEPAPAQDITLTLSAANVAKLAATGEAQKLIFAMYDEEYTGGTNEYWTIQNAKLTYNTPAVPEPATATLSLLALAGLAARRRRH